MYSQLYVSVLWATDGSRLQKRLYHFFYYKRICSLDLSRVRKILQTRVENKSLQHANYYRRVYKHRLQQYSYYRRVYWTRVGTMFLHTDAFTNIVCSRILTIDAYNTHAFEIWFFTPTRLQTSSVVGILLQTRLLHTRWHYVFSHRQVYKHRLQQDSYYRRVQQTRVSSKSLLQTCVDTNRSLLRAHHR